MKITNTCSPVMDRDFSHGLNSKNCVAFTQFHWFLTCKLCSNKIISVTADVTKMSWWHVTLFLMFLNARSYAIMMYGSCSLIQHMAAFCKQITDLLHI